MDILLLIGTLLVGLISFFRFNTPPPALHHKHEGESPLHRLQRWFSFNTGQPDLLLPPRANTTLFKFLVYRVSYVLIAIVIYLGLMKIGGLSREVDAIIELSMKFADMEVENFPRLSKSGPIMMAFIFAVVLPRLPPLASADAFIRSELYERAAIPAQQFRELQRLKEARFIPDPAMLQLVRSHLREDGFDPADLEIDEQPSTRSLWTKAVLLMRHLQHWSTEPQYQAAFTALKEVGDSRRSLDVLCEMYRDLVGEAKTVLADVHSGNVDADTEQRFRHSTKTFLYHVYNLLSRVSLHAHYSESERVRCMRGIGFQLDRRSLSSGPDLNDLVMLMLIVGVAIVLPLSLLMSKPLLAPLIGIIIYSAILVPIGLARGMPWLLTKNSDSLTPNVAFPVLSAFAAAGFSGLLICTYLFAETRSFAMVVERYSMSWPWALEHAGIAVLVAWRIQVKPAQGKSFGNLADAVIFAMVSLVILALVMLLLSRTGRLPGSIWLPFVVLGFATGLIGYFIPTWYRNNNYHHQERRSHDRDAFDSRRQRHQQATSRP